MALLTDRTLAASSAITASTLLHIVDVNDFSQNPAGSSYKANLGQLSSFFSGTSANIYNSNGNLTGNRTVSQGSFDLDFTGNENSRLKTVYTSTINPLDYGIFETRVFNTNIYHNDDTNDTYFDANLVPGNSSMNVGLISTNESGGINFNSNSSSLFHYNGIGTTIEVKADINGVSINQNSGFGYYFPNTYGFSGQVMTTDGAGNTSWQPLSSLSGSSVISVTGVTTSAYTATTSYSYYGVEYSGVTDIEIPDATGLNGFTFRVKDERGTASTYPITITPSSGNIDGNPSVTMSINYMSLTMVARNNNWWII